ncbi:MAG: serine dehydratase subunit alpha family protein [Ruminococcaceae bacterium]|nr:serine dehydratase subunit alpha family protein [Oscillospiraceae bacterium]
MLAPEIITNYTAILMDELRPAMGCTEPIAIAYAASILTDVLGGRASEISVGLSGNIIKNVKSVVVPATGGMHGIESAVAAGVIANAHGKKLEVLSALQESDVSEIRAFKESCKISICELNTRCSFDLHLTGKLGDNIANVRITETHTNVVEVTLNNESLIERYCAIMSSDSGVENSKETRENLLNVRDIVAFAEEVQLDELRPYLERQIELNMAISEEGLKNTYGASIGQLLLKGEDSDTSRIARAYAAAGSDARMSGCELAVCILSGSGNQGITASVPVIIYAREKNIDHETLLRSLIVSDLVTVHQKSGIGCLSAYCGAISAGCGCGAGIAYLLGGRYYEIAHTIVNAVAILSGTICDGAKPSCAAKIAMAVEAGILGYNMAITGRQFYGGDGIVTKGVENTIRNIGRLARDGMEGTDKEIIRIMLEQ